MRFRTYRPDEDGKAVYRLRRLAFGGTRNVDPEWLLEQDGWAGIVAKDGDIYAGFLRFWRFGQFFGGRSVPMGGIASVAVEPSLRGRGVAGRLLDAALVAMRGEGLVLSALYPAAAPLYRSRGWEQVGAYQTFVLPTAILPRHKGIATRPGTSDDVSSMVDAYTRTASQVDGAMDRASPAFDPADVLTEDVFTVVPAEPGITGYLIAERPIKGTRLVVRDLVADDMASARALLATVASWAGQLDSVSFQVFDPVVYGLVLALPYEVELRTQPWMLRVIDLVAAVAARGWPMAAALRPCAVDVEVIDEHAPWQHGRFRIVCDEGTVRCEPGGSGAVRLTPRGLSAWYAGAATTASLHRAGLLDGDLAAAAALDALTGAPRTLQTADAF